MEAPRKALEHPSHQPATPCSPPTSFSTAVLCVGLKHFRVLLFIMPIWLQHSNNCSLGARDILSGSCDFTHRRNQVSPRKLHMHPHLAQGQSERPRQAVRRDFLARRGLPTLPATSGSSLCHPSRGATPSAPSIPPSDSWSLSLPYAETQKPQGGPCSLIESGAKSKLVTHCPLPGILPPASPLLL